MILANATIGLPVSGETVFRLFMPNQHRIDSGTSDSSQAKPAFWIQVGVPAAILPKIQPLSFTSVIGSPPNAPKMPTVITSGITICMVVTPKLPRPAFSPSAVPCSRFGKKVLMLDIELAKLPPPTPRPQRHQLERPQRPVLVLQHDAGADRRRQQHRGGQEDRVAPARQADQERRRDAHRRAGDPGDRGQREQLRLGERKAQVEHLHGDDSPHAPDGEAAQQRGHRDPEVAVGDLLAGASPRTSSSSGRQSAMSARLPAVVPRARLRWWMAFMMFLG